MIFAGDVGGTKSNLALYEVREGKLRLVEQRRFANRDFTRVEDLLGEFARPARGKLRAACLGVAGPVISGRVRFTNLPWAFDAEGLARLLGLDHVVLVNDMEATAHSLDITEPRQLSPLQAGAAIPGGNEALIAAGTGLGECLWSWVNGRRTVVSTEGGHTDFAPRSDEEIEFLRFLMARQKRVSVEQVASGRGFRAMHEFYKPSARHASFDDPAADPAVEITLNARTRSCETCVKAVDFWLTLYGAEAGNLALKSLAVGGFYVAGGIAIKLLDLLQNGRFVQAFREKAEHEHILAGIPIQVLLDEEAPLHGAAARALHELGASH